MRIKIDSVDYVYRLLKRPPQDREEVISGEEWKRPKAPRRITPFGIQYSPSKLVFPLDDANVIFKKWGDRYSCTVPIDSEDKRVFLGTGKRLTEELGKVNYKFIPHNAHNDESVGYIQDGSSDYVFSINDANGGFLRLFSMGSFGSASKNFPANKIGFAKEIAALESMVNIFIECLLFPYQDREEVSSRLNDIVCLNP